jgi:very-short-patch-repair endonuclease
MFPYNPILQEQAKYLKDNLSKADKTVEKLLKENFPDLLVEIKVPIDDYIVDFFVPEKKIVFEIDAGQQENTDAYVYHAERKERLENLGLKVYRLEENMILNDSKELIYIITRHCEDSGREAD